MRFQRELAKHISPLGWKIEHTKGGHFRLRHPVITQTIYTASTPTDPGRTLRNIMADVKRAARNHRGAV